MRPYEDFANTLNVAITQAGLLKNEMIRKLGIDRSSYFQILKGRRLPTSDQYRELKQLLLLPKEDSINLDDAYYRSVFGDITWNNILYVRDMIRLLSETESDKLVEYREVRQLDALVPDINSQKRVVYLGSRADVNSGIVQVLNRALFSGELSFFMPSSNEVFYDFLRQLLATLSNTIHIRQLTGLPGTRVSERKEAVGVYQGLLVSMGARGKIDLDCRYYYNSVSKISDIGQLYPWYIITKEKVLMLAPDFRSGIISNDEEMVRAYTEQFDRAFQEAEPMLKAYDSLNLNLRAVRDYTQQRHQVNYEAIPCSAMLATPEIIRKYMIPKVQEELILHCEELQKKSSMVDIASISGLKRFIERKKVPEIPESYMKELELRDLIWYMDQLLERLGTTLFIIDERRIPPVYDWDITITEDESVMIMNHNFDMILLNEKNIVDMFTSFAGHISETPFVLDVEKARTELLNIRSELVGLVQKTDL